MAGAAGRDTTVGSGSLHEPAEHPKPGPLGQIDIHKIVQSTIEQLKPTFEEVAVNAAKLATISVQEEKEKLEHKLLEKENELQKLKRDFEEQRQKKRDGEEKIRTLENEVQKLKKNSTQTKTAIQEKEEEIERLKAYNKLLNEEQNLKKQKETEIAQLKTEIQKLNQEIKKQEKSAGDEEMKRKQTEASLKADIDEQIKKADKAKSEAGVLKSAQNVARQELRDVRKRADILLKENELLKRQLPKNKK